MKIDIIDEQIDQIMIQELKSIIEFAENEHQVLAAKILLEGYNKKAEDFKPMDWASLTT